MTDIEELHKIDTSEIYSRRINAKKVLMLQKENYFIFPIAESTAKLMGRDHEFRESAIRQEQPGRSEHLSGELQGEQEGFFNRQNQESTLKPRKTSGRNKVTSSIVITWNLEFKSS